MVFSSSSPKRFLESHFILDVLSCSLLCLAVIRSPKASPVIIKNIPIDQRVPFEHLFRAAVTFEQRLLSDKLEDNEGSHSVFPNGSWLHKQPLGL